MTFQSNKVLKNLVRLLNERNFITRRKLLGSDKTEFISYKYGPPGASLRNNLITNWREEVQFSNNNEPCFFVENATLPFLNNNYNSLSQNSTRDGHFWSSDNYITHSLQSCAHTLRRTNIKLPFTIARIGVSYDSNSSEKIFLFDSNEKTNLTLLCFCSPDSSAKTFETLLQQRLYWWQQFANFSSNFQLTQTKNIQHTNNNNNKNKLFLSSGVEYHFPWGWNTIEKTTILETTTYSLTQLSVPTGDTDVIGDVLKASVVVSNVTLEKGLLALLYDSYQERTKKLPKNIKNKTKQPVTAATKDSTESTGFLKLHSILSPYKVGVATYGKKTRQLRQLAQRVVKDLKTLDVQILGSTETASSLESQRIAYEQIGVLYMVIISDKSLETGFTRIKNHERKDQEEQVHVSEIKEYMVEHLKLVATFQKSQQLS